MSDNWTIKEDESVLVTGANGFVGAAVVKALAKLGVRRIRGMVRSVERARELEVTVRDLGASLELVEGNLLVPDDCARAVPGVSVIFHLAAATDKSFSSSFYKTVVSTKNLLEAAGAAGPLKRLVHVSSFAIYSNWKIRRGGMLDETCPIEDHPQARHEPYCFAKLGQERLVAEWADEQGVPLVTIRPGAVYGPKASQAITPRVGIDSFGFFLHLGGGNRIPLTYVDNCAEAIALAGLVHGVESEVFNIVDDELPRSRTFLRGYRRNVGRFFSCPVPYPLFYLFSAAWEKYAIWSGGQFGPLFNRKRCAAYWKGNKYSNDKAKRLLKWKPRVSTAEGMQRHFDYFKNQKVDA